MAAGIAGSNEDSSLESASLARVDSARARWGTISGLAVGIDMVEAYETGAWSFMRLCSAPGIGIQFESASTS